MSAHLRKTEQAARAAQARTAYRQAERDARRAGDTAALAELDRVRRLQRSRRLQEAARRTRFTSSAELLEAGDAIDDERRDWLSE